MILVALKIKMNMQEMLKSVYEYNVNLGKRKILNKIIRAMKFVDRKFFVSSSMSSFVYADMPLSIGGGQTISQPSTVARMLLLVELKPRLDVLEIGAGSGWNATLLSYLVYPGKVTAVERINFLTENAKNNIKRFIQSIRKKDRDKFKNLNLITEDALDEKSLIWRRKYDRIIITAGIINAETERKIEKMASILLKNKGILICPYTAGPMIIYKKNKIIKRTETHEEYVFVPLVREAK